MLKFPLLVHLSILSPSGDPKNVFLMKLDGASANLRLFKADMLDYDTVAAAFDGCEGVFHVATPVPEHEMVDPQACLDHFDDLRVGLRFSKERCSFPPILPI